jgi:hypothetical protein
MVGKSKHIREQQPVARSTGDKGELMNPKLTCFIAAISLSLISSIATAAIVATGNTTSTFEDSKAFTIFNGDTANISEAQLSFSIVSQRCLGR